MVEVECAQQQSVLSISVPLLPATTKNLPLGVELSADAACILRIQCSEEDGERVVAGCRGQLIVALLVEFEGCGAGLFGEIRVELAGGGLSRRDCS